MSIEAHDVEARDGTRLRLWEASAPSPDRAVLFVHGATYASRAIFAPRGAPGRTWLGSVADAGAAGFALDLRGYGDSERPAAMAGLPEAARPPVRGDAAAADLRDAVDAVAGRVEGDVHLVGTSWGTMVAGRLLDGDDAPDLASVTLHAPVYRPDPALVEGFDLGEPPRAYRTVAREEARRRWDEQLPGEGPARYRGGDVDSDPTFDAFWRTLVESGQGTADGTVVAPNGTLLDLRDATNGDPGYDPAAIDVPTLVVRGSLDPTSTRADACALYDALSPPGDAAKYVEITGGSHFVHLEQRREALFDAVDRFQRRY